MDRLRRMAVFASVVERRSMRGAAAELGLTPSAVSQHLRQLERELGVTLLHRTTRKMTPTVAGERYYEGCAEMVRAARLADERLASCATNWSASCASRRPPALPGPCSPGRWHRCSPPTLACA